MRAEGCGSTARWVSCCVMTHNTGKKRERERDGVSMGVAAVPLTCRLSVSMRLQANLWLHLFKCKRGSKGAGVAGMSAASER